MPSIRAHPDWRELLDEPDPMHPAHGMPVDLPSTAKDPLDIYEIMTRGKCENAIGLACAVNDATAPGGSFTPPVVLVAGELELVFDAVEALRATVAVIAPFVLEKTGLAAAMAHAQTFLSTAIRDGRGSMAKALRAELLSALAQERKAPSPALLDSHVERMLLEQRHFQRRTLLGQRWMRTLLLPAGGSRHIPALLPESASASLPLFRRMRVRLIAEVDLQQDQDEADHFMLRVLALARAVPLTHAR
jgi:hypothetical protein